MIYSEVINQVKEDASEWLEMSNNPTEMLVGILAQKIVKLNFTLEILQKRIKAMERLQHVDAVSNY
jgi:hypothetical protein